MSTVVRTILAIALVGLIAYSTTTHSYEIDKYGVKRQDAPDICFLLGENNSRWFQDVEEEEYWSCFSDLYLDTDANGASLYVIGDEYGNVQAAWITLYMTRSGRGHNKLAKGVTAACEKLQGYLGTNYALYRKMQSHSAKLRCSYGEVPDKYLEGYEGTS